jgi:4-hydroxy-2-oxoheptanedioate aldolase
MRSRLVLAAVAVIVLGAVGTAQAPRRQRLNPMIDLLEQKKPVFGLYAPSAGGGRGARGLVAAGQPATPAPARTPLDLAKEALAYTASDFIFSGSMEGGLDRPSGLPAFTEFVTAVGQAGQFLKTPSPRFSHPLVVKTPEIAPDPAKARDNISRQLNLGVSAIMFVKVESAQEVRQGLAAMRFTSKGGTRPENVGSAPAFWGMSEAEYRRRADLWPPNPDGELVNWTIIESKEGLARVREIAAVPGIGVLWPGAGTLGGVFSTTDASGQRVRDTAAWEAAIQQVLSACKEFNVPCGFPASPDNIEMRMKQGFSVFVMNWGEAGFKAVEIGRKASGR